MAERPNEFVHSVDMIDAPHVQNEKRTGRNSQVLSEIHWLALVTSPRRIENQQGRPLKTVSLPVNSLPIDFGKNSEFGQAKKKTFEIDGPFHKATLGFIIVNFVDMDPIGDSEKEFKKDREI